MGASREAEEKLIGWRGETYNVANVEAKWDPLKHEPKDSIPLPGRSSRPGPTRLTHSSELVTTTCHLHPSVA